MIATAAVTIAQESLTARLKGCMDFPPMKRLIVDLPTFGHCAVLTVNRAYPVYPVLPTFSSAVGISQTVREPTSQLAVILCNQSGMVPIPKRRVADMAARSRICSLKQQRLGHVQLTPQPASRRGNGRRH